MCMASVQTLLLSSTRNVVTRSVLGPPEYSFEFMRIFSIPERALS